MLKRLLLVVTAAALVAPAAPAGAAAVCAPVEIGRSATEPSRILDQNDRGVLVGSVNDWGYSGDHREQPYVRRDGVLTLLDKGGWTYGEAVAVNNRGQVLGTARSEPNRVDNAILWDAQGNPTKLNPNEDGVAAAYDLNDRGDALVRIDSALGIWRAGRFTPIPVPAGKRFTEPATLNESGWAVGRTDVAQDQGRIDAWVWDGKRRWDITSPFGGQYDSTSAVALNVRGQVVGVSISSNVSGDKRVSWLWQRGRLVTLTAPGGEFSPVDIDDRGRILGTITSGANRRVAIREVNGRYRDLGTFGASGPDSEVVAVALNNQGQVVVYAGPIAHGTVYLWRAGRTVALPAPAGFQQLLPPGAWNYQLSLPEPLNERGEVYTHGTLTNYQTHGVYWGRCN